MLRFCEAAVFVTFCRKKKNFFFPPDVTLCAKPHLLRLLSFGSVIHPGSTILSEKSGSETGPASKKWF